MSKIKEKNFAYIDGNNLYCGIRDSGWLLDYKKYWLYSYIQRNHFSLIKFLMRKNRFKVLLVPHLSCSFLFKKTGAKITYLKDQKKLLENKKAPDTD